MTANGRDDEVIDRNVGELRRTTLGSRAETLLSQCRTTLMPRSPFTKWPTINPLNNDPVIEHDQTSPTFPGATEVTQFLATKN